MAVDADSSTEGIDVSASRVVAEEFDVGTDITAAGTPYIGYQMSIEFDDEILTFVPVGDKNITYTGLGYMVFNLEASVPDNDSDGRPEIYGAAVRPAGTTQATGRANDVRFRCIAPGTTSLHLLTFSESTDLCTTTRDYPYANFIPTVLQDATITCSPAAASPTPTATVPPVVGGIADLPALGASQAGPSDLPAVRQGSRGTIWAALALAATGVVATTAFAWYARRRRLG
jgi:hypothetical protein